MIYIEFNMGINFIYGKTGARGKIWCFLQYFRATAIYKIIEFHNSNIKHLLHFQLAWPLPLSLKKELDLCMK